MRLRIVLATVGAVALFIPVSAWALNPKTGTEKRYVKMYDKAFEIAGAQVGRDLVHDGYGKTYRRATKGELEKSISRLGDVINPPPAPVIEAPVSTTPVPTESSYDSSSYSTETVSGTPPEYIAECESGGSYTASNPSGAYGKWQIMPGTAASYGCDLSTPAGQDSCAAEIYADVGSSAWVCG